jgi:hypothetical protein
MCELHNNDCRYDKPPPMSQLISMANRLQEAEQALAEMQGGFERAPEPLNLSHADAKSPTTDPGQLSPASQPEISRASIAPAPSSLDQLLSAKRPSSDPMWNEEQPATSYIGDSTSRETTTTELTVDEYGSVRYYGPTSAVHEPSPAMFDTNSPDSVNPKAETRASLVAHARESAIWEEFAIGNASAQTGVPRQVIADLLHIYWTWIAPMFLWVHRSAFIRTLCYSPYFSNRFTHSYKLIN